MDVAAAQLLVEAVKGKDVALAGIQCDQTSADFYDHGLKPPDAVLLASDLSKADVSTCGADEFSESKHLDAHRLYSAVQKHEHITGLPHTPSVIVTIKQHKSLTPLYCIPYSLHTFLTQVIP